MASGEVDHPPPPLSLPSWLYVATSFWKLAESPTSKVQRELDAFTLLMLMGGVLYIGGGVSNSGRSLCSTITGDPATTTAGWRKDARSKRLISN